MSYDPEAFDAFEAAGWAEKDAGAYDMLLARVTAMFAEPLLDAVEAGPGTRLLDLATGPGVRRRACCRPRSGGCRARPLRRHARVRARARRPVPTFVRGDVTATPIRGRVLRRRHRCVPSAPSRRARAGGRRGGARARAGRCRRRSRSGTCRVEDAGSACSSTRSRRSASRHAGESLQDRRSSASPTRRSSPTLITGARLGRPDVGVGRVSRSRSAARMSSGTG